MKDYVNKNGLAKFLELIKSKFIYIDAKDSNQGTPNLINADTLGGITKENLVSLVYPVGSIYMATNAVNPATLFGGTWERIEDTFLLAAGSQYSAGSTGGEAKHTLAVSEMPSHNHTRGTMNITGALTERPASSSSEILSGNLGGGGGAFYTEADTIKWNVPVTTSGSASRNNNLHKFDASRAWTGETSEAGESVAHNNMPPYLAVYMWRRTA